MTELTRLLWYPVGVLAIGGYLIYWALRYGIWGRA